jgi:DNA-binding response OmpR family regulator
MSSNALRRLMLVDDDQTIIDVLAYNLNRHGYTIHSFKCGTDALAQFDQISPVLVILDWVLPDIAGPEICKIIRSRSSEVPILMLTGKADPHDVAKGLDSGADDYLSKPFSIVEIVARIQALLRRSAKDLRSAAGGRLEVDNLTLDFEKKEVTQGGQRVDLSPKEFALLKVLMQNAGKTLNTETLLNRVWGPDFSGDIKTVAVHMRWLRQKLERDAKSPELIQTVQRSGYRLNKREGTNIKEQSGKTTVSGGQNEN